jgi:hypothetical protein
VRVLAMAQARERVFGPIFSRGLGTFASDYGNG